MGEETTRIEEHRDGVSTRLARLMRVCCMPALLLLLGPISCNISPEDEAQIAAPIFGFPAGALVLVLLVVNLLLLLVKQPGTGCLVFARLTQVVAAVVAVGVPVAVLIMVGSAKSGVLGVAFLTLLALLVVCVPAFLVAGRLANKARSGS